MKIGRYVCSSLKYVITWKGCVDMYYVLTMDKLNAFSSPRVFDWIGFLTWFSLNIVLSLMPLIFGFALLAFIVKWQVKGRHYLNLLKDGQLSFFSTTLAATLISRLLTVLPLLLKDPTKSTKVSGAIFLIVALLIILIIATLFFGESMTSAFESSPDDAIMLLQSLQFRLNRLMDKCQTKRIAIPTVKQDKMVDELSNIKSNQLKKMESQCNFAKSFANDIEQQLGGQPKMHDGMRDNAWGQASISIVLAIAVIGLAAFVFNSYGGM